MLFTLMYPSMRCFSFCAAFALVYRSCENNLPSAVYMLTVLYLPSFSILQSAMVGVAIALLPIAANNFIFTASGMLASSIINLCCCAILFIVASSNCSFSLMMRWISFTASLLRNDFSSVSVNTLLDNCVWWPYIWRKFLIRFPLVMCVTLPPIWNPKNSP